MISYLKDVIDLTPFLGTPPVEGVRYNPRRCGEADFLRLAPFRVAPSPYFAGGYRITGGAADGNHPYHAAGMYYFQEPSAMSAVTALQVRPGDRVLDACAAPGSKATAIAGLLQGGLLVANEWSRTRAHALLSNLERMGAARAVVTNSPVERLAQAAPRYFDRVLVDSPCSGEGMFRKYPRITEEWSEALVAHCAARSRAILEAAAQTLRPGGRLVYSTCTFNLEENEKTVLWFLARHPEFRPVPAGIPGAAAGLIGLTEAARIFPGAEGEGHFVCALEHTGSGAAADLPGCRAGRHPEAAAFLKSITAGIETPHLLRCGDYYYLADPDLPELQGVNVLRAGIQAMEQKGRQLRPAHHLAMALPTGAPLFTEPLTLDRAREYLHGLTVPCARRGYGVVTIEGMPLGWIKADGAQGKNHLPKGLRTL